MAALIRTTFLGLGQIHETNDMNVFIKNTLWGLKKDVTETFLNEVKYVCERL